MKHSLSTVASSQLSGQHLNTGSTAHAWFSLLTALTASTGSDRLTATPAHSTKRSTGLSSLPSDCSSCTELIRGYPLQSKKLNLIVASMATTKLTQWLNSHPDLQPLTAHSMPRTSTLSTLPQFPPGLASLPPHPL